MRLQILPILLTLSCIPAAIPATAADRNAIVQGAGATVTGFARVHRGAEGTYIELENSNYARAIAGFIAFRNEGTFPGVMALNGRRVQITGMVALYGRPMISLNAPEQLQVIRE